MRELRLLTLAALFGLPLAWSATLAAETRSETVNQALSAFFLGTLPLLGAMLCWGENFRGSDVDVRYGLSRRVFAMKNLLRTVGALIVGALLASSLSLLVLRGPSDPLLVKDLVATTPVAVAAGVSLGCFFAASRAWFGRAGVALALLLAWVVGPLNLVIAASVPTGHVRHLLGLGAELPLPAWGSFVALYGMALILGSLLFARIPR